MGVHMPIEGNKNSKPVTGNGNGNLIDVSSAKGPQKINGGGGNDQIIGSIYADTVNAGDGDDVFRGGLGNDEAHGGDGFDTAVFSGSVFDYIFQAGKGNAIIVKGADGTDTLKQFEALQFDDYTYFLDGRNNSPFTRADLARTNEDGALASIDVLANDMDIDRDGMTIVSVSGGANGTSVATNGVTVSYDPGTAFQSLSEGMTATDSFVYTVEDGRGGSRTETVTVTIEGQNDAPEFEQAAYAFAIDENNAAGAAIGMVVASDIDSGDAQFYSITGGTGMGLFSVDDEGNITANGPLDYEFASGYTLDIEVRDRATGGLTDSTHVSIEVNDLQETGPLDLVVAGYSYSSVQSGVGILKGNGDGSFVAPVVTSSGLSYNGYSQYNKSVALGDVNNDGLNDFVFGGVTYEYNSAAGAKSISVILNNGDGTLKSPETYSSELGYESVYYGTNSYQDVNAVKLVDLNSDGNLDIIASGYGYSQPGYYDGAGHGMSVLMGNGDGTFQAAETYSIQTSSSSTYYQYQYGRDVEMGDLNNDGKLDAVVVGYSDSYSGHSGGVSVLLGNGDGSFQGATNHRSNIGYSTSYEDLADVALADFNNDGSLDIVTGGYAYNYGSAAGSLSLMLGNGDGTFAGPQLLSNGLGYSSGSYSYENTTALAAADLDGDGNVDLVVGGGNYYHSSEHAAVSVLMGNGDGTFKAPTLLASPSNSYNARDLIVADLEGDGMMDIAVLFENGNAGVYSGNGDGSFDPVVMYDDGVDYGYALAAADLGGYFA